MWMTSSLWNAISSQVSMWSTCLCSIHPTNHWMVTGKIMTTELVCFGCSSCIFSYVLLCIAVVGFVLFHHGHALVCAGSHLMLKLLVDYFILKVLHYILSILLFRNRLHKNASSWLMNMPLASAHQSLVTICWLHRTLKGKSVWQVTLPHSPKQKHKLSKTSARKIAFPKTQNRYLRNWESMNETMLPNSNPSMFY